MKSWDQNAVICTIVAKNYISFARTLADSFLGTNPDGKCYVLIVDDIEGFVDPAEEPFSLLSLQDLDIKDCENLAFRYNITEFSTSVKPFLLDYLLNEKKHDRVLYIDPDIMVTDSLSGIFEKLDHFDIVLTPHLDRDYPDDGMLPNDGHIMKSGIYNLGFIGLKASENTTKFLRWWQVKLRDRCVVEHQTGYFVDQKFIDYAQPLFSGIGFIRDIGCNVAYWNLHSRQITRENGNWLCNGEPLIFFHFSDYKPHLPNSISRHQNRFSFDSLPQLKALFDEYRSLLEKNGFERTRQWPYSHGTYRNGRVIGDADRQIFRENPSLQALDDPFDWSLYPWRKRFGIARRKFAFWAMSKAAAVARRVS